MQNDDQLRRRLYDLFQQHNVTDVSPATEALICCLWEAVDHLFMQVRLLKSVGHVHAPTGQDAPAFDSDGYSTALPRRTDPDTLAAAETRPCEGGDEDEQEGN